MFRGGMRDAEMSHVWPLAIGSFVGVVKAGHPARNLLSDIPAVFPICASVAYIHVWALCHGGNCWYCHGIGVGKWQGRRTIRAGKPLKRHHNDDAQHLPQRMRQEAMHGRFPPGYGHERQEEQHHCDRDQRPKTADRPTVISIGVKLGSKSGAIKTVSHRPSATQPHVPLMTGHARSQ